MIHPLRAWNQFFFRPTSARPLGAIRIIYGLLALANLAFCTVELDYWYTDKGLLQGGEAWTVAGPWQFSPLLFVQDPTSVRIAFAFTATAAALLTVGFRTRMMSILFYLGMLSIHNRNLVSSSGADVLLLTFGFNLMLSPCGAAYSVDSWLRSRKRGTIAEPLILPWSVRLIQIQIGVVYACAAILKTGGGLWLNGDVAPLRPEQHRGHAVRPQLPHRVPDPHQSDDLLGARDGVLARLLPLGQGGEALCDDDGLHAPHGNSGHDQHPDLRRADVAGLPRVPHSG